MTKKEYVLSILNAVKDTRNMAPWLKILLENDSVDDTVIDTLVKLFRDAAAKTNDQKSKMALEKSATLVENLHDKEEVEHEKDLADLAELESMFKDM